MVGVGGGGGGGGRGSVQARSATKELVQLLKVFGVEVWIPATMKAVRLSQHRARSGHKLAQRIPALH